MNFWTPENVRSHLGSLGAVWIRRPEHLAVHMTAIAGVSTDSRSVRLDQAFVALKGENFDGHDYVASVAEGGVPLIIVERDLEAAEWPSAPDSLAAQTGVLKVTDTRKALLRLAAAYRRSLKVTKVIAVCGSNGKTTTVRLIDAALSTHLRGSHSPKSFNNDIGVPLTILNAKSTDQYLICEVGTNAPGEIATLAAVVEPDVAVITSIGREHLEFLGSIEGVAREEAAVVSSVRTGGLAVVIADAPALRAFVREGPGVLFFGDNPDAGLRLTAFEQGIDEQGRAWSHIEVNARGHFRTPLTGRHNAVNTLAAIAVARRLGLDDATIAAGLAQAKAPEMRWETRRIGGGEKGVTIVNDAYNANPDSMLASVRTFAELYVSAKRRVMVMGDMRELGAGAPQLHEEIGREVAHTGAIDVFITIGELAAHAAKAARGAWEKVGADAKVVEFASAEEAGTIGEITALLRPGDAVLLKGSRRMKLERIVAAAQERFAPAVRTRAAASGAAKGEGLAS